MKLRKGGDMEIVDYYTTHAHEIISQGYIKGGIAALKDKYPDAYREMEEKLEKNYTKEGVDTYCRNFIRGLKAVNAWKE